MGLDFHLDGLREPDDAHKAKVAALKACRAAKIAIPPELAVYFEDHGYDDPDGALCVDIKAAIVEGGSMYGECEDTTIDLRKLPAGVVKIRARFSC